MSTTQYQVIVRSGSTDLFLASVLGIEDCVGEGPTKEVAIARARAALLDRLSRGEIVTIDVENEPMSADNVWRDEAGRFRDDPTFDEFVTETRSERETLNSEDPPS